MKIDQNPWLSAITSLLLLSSSFQVTDLLAEPPPDVVGSNQLVHPGSSAFSIHDTDQNGSLSRKEYIHFIAQIETRHEVAQCPVRHYSPPLSFDEIDSNGDESLTRSELISALNTRLQRHRLNRYKGGRW
jgi:hypothetical protein